MNFAAISLSFRLALATLLAATPCVTLGAEMPSGPLGNFDPEQSCLGPTDNPVCTYKTWFFCRVADLDDMCNLVLGKGPVKEWENRPWLLPLSLLIAGPLGIHGYAFIGTLKVDEARLTQASKQVKQRLLGSYEVMDTYADPTTPGVAYVGSEFYAETKPGHWTLVGWSLSAEGGQAANECEEPQNKSNDICKLRVDDIPSWLQMMRGQDQRPHK